MGKNSTTEEFIQKAKKIHGNKYNYSLVVYTKRTEKVKLICPIHGIFEQRAGCHISNGRGCAKCRILNLFLTNEDFIKKAQKKHKNKYAKENGIRLIRIPFTKINNIDELLSFDLNIS